MNVIGQDGWTIKKKQVCLSNIWNDHGFLRIQYYKFIVLPKDNLLTGHVFNDEFGNWFATISFVYNTIVFKYSKKDYSKSSSAKRGAERQLAKLLHKLVAGEDNV